MTPQELEEIEHNQIISWGKYKGRSFKDVPASYLLWFNEQDFSNDYAGTKAYVIKYTTLLLIRYKRETGYSYKPKRIVQPLVPPPPSPLHTIQLTEREMSDEELALTLSVFSADINQLEIEPSVVNKPRVKAILQPLKEKVINVLLDDVRALEL